MGNVIAWIARVIISALTPATAHDDASRIREIQRNIAMVEQRAAATKAKRDELERRIKSVLRLMKTISPGKIQVEHMNGLKQLRADHIDKMKLILQLDRTASVLHRQINTIESAAVSRDTTRLLEDCARHSRAIDLGEIEKNTRVVDRAIRFQEDNDDQVASQLEAMGDPSDRTLDAAYATVSEEDLELFNNMVSAFDSSESVATAAAAASVMDSPACALDESEDYKSRESSAALDALLSRATRAPGDHPTGNSYADRFAMAHPVAGEGTAPTHIFDLSTIPVDI
jgi:septal ring factor EnvC (AmiA/AmiB activator)